MSSNIPHLENIAKGFLKYSDNTPENRRVFSKDYGVDLKVVEKTFQEIKPDPTLCAPYGAPYGADPISGAIATLAGLSTAQIHDLGGIHFHNHAHYGAAAPSVHFGEHGSHPALPAAHAAHPALPAAREDGRARHALRTIRERNERVEHAEHDATRIAQLERDELRRQIADIDRAERVERERVERERVERERVERERVERERVERERVERDRAERERAERVERAENDAARIAQLEREIAQLRASSQAQQSFPPTNGTVSPLRSSSTSVASPQLRTMTATSTPFVCTQQGTSPLPSSRSCDRWCSDGASAFATRMAAAVATNGHSGLSAPEMAAAAAAHSILNHTNSVLPPQQQLLRSSAVDPAAAAHQ